VWESSTRRVRDPVAGGLLPETTNASGFPAEIPQI
jgi:hypothetical protein